MPAQDRVLPTLTPRALLPQHPHLSLSHSKHTHTHLAQPRGRLQDQASLPKILGILGPRTRSGPRASPRTAAGGLEGSLRPAVNFVDLEAQFPPLWNGTRIAPGSPSCGGKHCVPIYNLKTTSGQPIYLHPPYPPMAPVTQLPCRHAPPLA